MRLILLMCLSALLHTATSQTIKMKINGVTIAAGEDVMAFETGDTTSSTSTSGGSVSKPRFEYIKIKKLNGPSSLELFRRSISSTRTAEVIFEFFDNNGNIFYKVAVHDVTITHFSYLSPECPGCGKLYNQIWFDYVKIEVVDAVTGNKIIYDRNLNKF